MRLKWETWLETVTVAQTHHVDSKHSLETAHSMDSTALSLFLAGWIQNNDKPCLFCSSKAVFLCVAYVCLGHVTHSHTHTYSTGHVKRDPHYRSITNQFQTSERNIFQVKTCRWTHNCKPAPASRNMSCNQCRFITFSAMCIYKPSTHGMSMSRRHQQLLQSLPVNSCGPMV